LGITGLFILITLISFLLPSEVHGRRGVVVNAPQDIVHQQVAVFYNWKNWHPEFAANNSNISYTDVGSSEHAKCRITVNGKATDYNITWNDVEKITVLQKRAGQNDIENIFTFSKDTATGGTYVDWKFISPLKWYPWEKFAAIFTESMTAPLYEQALDSLKKVAEAQR
jgi:hypothetical protein